MLLSDCLGCYRSFFFVWPNVQSFGHKISVPVFSSSIGQHLLASSSGCCCSVHIVLCSLNSTKRRILGRGKELVEPDHLSVSCHIYTEFGWEAVFLSHGNVKHFVRFLCFPQAQNKQVICGVIWPPLMRSSKGFSF